MRQLPFADEIVVLDTGGKVAQIGDFEALNAIEGYVQNLAVQQKSSDPDDPVHDKESTSQTKQAPSTKKPKEPSPRVIGTRDKAIYRFYLAPIGILRCLVLLAAVFSLAVATRFQRR